MMQISHDEHFFITIAIEAGRRHGYGNIISHLATAWKRKLIESGMSDEAAEAAVFGPCYPLAMQYDILERRQWDETGKSYRPTPASSSPS